MDKATLAKHLENGLSLEKIGAIEDKHASTVGYWLRKHGLVATGHDAHAPKGPIDRLQLTRLVDEGLSVSAITREVHRSRTVVQYWLRRYGLQTVAGKRKAEGRVARAQGLKIASLACSTHGMTDFVLEGRGAYRCMRCRQDRVTRRRQQMKRILVEEAGGCCAVCGYSRHVGALHFHHLDPAEKKFNAAYRITRSLAALRTEVKKCILLCSNCHAEVEGGVIEIPKPSAALHSPG